MWHGNVIIGCISERANRVRLYSSCAISFRVSFAIAHRSQFMFLNGHGRHFYYFLGRAPIDCDPDRMYPTIDCRSGHMVIHELGFWIYGVNTHELNKLGLCFFRARAFVCTAFMPLKAGLRNALNIFSLR